MNTRAWMVVATTLLAIGCDEATVKLSLSNETTTAAPHQGLLDDGTSLRLKMIAVYLVEDVDPVTQNNIGNTAMVWLNPQCDGDIDGCNIEGFAAPSGGPRITSFFDLSRPTVEVNAELNSQGAAVSAGTYQYARVELCKAYGQGQATAPTMMWRGPGMTAEQAFSSGDCGRTSQRFAQPLDLAAGDSVEVTLGYDLGAAIVEGPPASPSQIAGQTHSYRACVDVDAMSRVCMDFPELTPSATKLP